MSQLRSADCGPGSTSGSDSGTGSGRPLTYADAGVDIDKSNKLIDKIKDIARRTPRQGVMSDIGGFGGLYSPNLSHMEHPVLVSATDGVGTKLKIAIALNKHDTIGIDLVAMCVNDIAVQGAKPLFFLDYLAMGTLEEHTVAAIIQGVGHGCGQANCALIGGETAELPDMYPEGEYDLAGFSVGLVDNEKIIDGSDIRVGHRLIGIPSTGIHSNGYSLVRRICFNVLGLKLENHVAELGKSLGEELLTPTKIYSEMIQHMIRDLPIHGIAHITGGGIDENIVRVIPSACGVLIYENAWITPPVFDFLQRGGNVEDREMRRTFNCGIGLILIAPEDHAPDILDRARALGEDPVVMGEITERPASGPRVRWIDAGA